MAQVSCTSPFSAVEETSKMAADQALLKNSNSNLFGDIESLRCDRCKSKKKKVAVACVDCGDLFLCNECNKKVHQEGSKLKHQLQDLRRGPNTPQEKTVNGIHHHKKSNSIAKLDITHNDKPKSLLLIDSTERIQVTDELDFRVHLGCESDPRVKVVSIFGNTGDGKSHTLNHTFFDGADVFDTSPSQKSCTVGVWVSYCPKQKAIIVDTEGLLGVSENANKRMRLLMKILAVSDIVIYRTRAERLHSDMFTFLGDASEAYIKYFTKDLQSVQQRGHMENVPLCSLGPSIIIFQETHYTTPLGYENGSSDNDATPEEMLRTSFFDIGRNPSAFSTINYVGTRTTNQPTDFSLLLNEVKKILKNSTVRSARPISVIFDALMFLNDKFGDDINGILPNSFPDEYFTCISKCLSCGQRCNKCMNHEKEQKQHYCEQKCTYQAQFDNRVYTCKICHEKGIVSLVEPKTAETQDSPLVGLAKYAWSGYVLECPKCGVIYRSRQFWYGNRDPVENSVRVEIEHVWPGTRLPSTSQNSARRVLDGMMKLADAITNVSAKPTKAVTNWVTDKVAPTYWTPNYLIIDCIKCGHDFEEMEKKHHCRACGRGFCDGCTQHRIPVPDRGWGDTPVRVCDDCFVKSGLVDQSKAQTNHIGQTNMAAYSKLTARNSAVATAALAASYFAYRNYLAKKRKRTPKEEIKVVIHEPGASKKERAAVDHVFFKRLLRILKILVPGWFVTETWYLLLVAASLISRTYADVWMIQNGTAIESAIIGRNMSLFKVHLFKFIYAMPAISIINNCLKYGLNELKLRFRIRLTKHLYDRYLRGFTYYKMSNLDNRIANADQLLTQDVDKFCDSVAELYSNLSKPLLDVVLYTAKLTGSIGAQGPAIMLGYLVVSGLILTRVRRPIGKLTVQEQKLEGEYRYVNSRLITNSEEIAFYQGNRREQTIILATFDKLVSHLKDFIFFRMQMGFVDNIIAKYIATVFGYLVVSRPFLNLAHPRHLNSSHSERLEDYYKSGRMLVRMAEAIGRIVLAGREMTRLAGFTARITELIKVLDDISQGHYERTMVSDQNGGKEKTSSNLKPGDGKIIIQDHIIRFDKVPLVTPNGDVLLQEMSFEVKSGENVLVCGPNGCGKSSLFRVLGELWPLFGGTMTKPEKGKLFYVPQRPYMTVGTLRDQVIYPDSHEEQIKKGTKDSDLLDILSKVQLEYILEREGGWDSVQDWMDVLSGGEKQRIAMARLFYHRPQFAILDECTSAVSVDVEGYMYQYCKEVGITLFTVSHRKSLWKHHEYYLKMDGRGTYEFGDITSDTTEFGS